MRIGTLDQRVILQSLSESNDGGDLVQSWANLATVSAMILSERGGEAFTAARNNATEAIRVKIRWRSDVTTKHRLQWRSQNYNITHVDRSQRRQGELWMTCQLSGAA